jgi:hypothetical protein
MNPYLEQESIWHDFHFSIIPAIRDQIVGQVVPKLFVNIDEYRFPVERSVQRNQAVIHFVDEVRLPYLKIERLGDRKIVTIIEFLAWDDKRYGPVRDDFITRRVGHTTGQMNYVEIDLLRGGPRIPTGHLPDCDYYALVSRASRRPYAEVWAVHLRDPLPVIPIPLSSSDPDAVLDLQAVLHRVYDSAKYEHAIYSGSPEPALSPDDAEWAKQFVPVRS